MLTAKAFSFFATFVAVNALAVRQSGNNGTCSAWSSWKPQPAVGAPVNTTSGTIVGHAAEGYPQVSEYLGIPFARPPLGDLRFAAPVPFNGTSTITADAQPSSCLQAPALVNYTQPQNWQNIAAEKADFANHTSEDCLYLNVWSKASTTLKPVMIWLYGGGFHSGGINDASENGALFANEQDIVMVSPNYRLDIFGFPGAPNVPANVGFLDQRLAVEWVRDNIAAFGGDPNKIVLFGHSAGGASTDFYTYAWTSDPIISASIPMSGTADNFGNRFPNTTEAGWSTAASLVGCGNLTASNADEILSCMRGKPAEDVFKASSNASDIVTRTLPGAAKLYAGITGIFGPTIDNKTVFENYTVQGLNGEFINAPMLIGSNNDEGCYFAEQGQIPVSDEEDLTEVIFTCPIEQEASHHAGKDAPTWKYRYYGAYPNLFAPDCPGEPWHGQELYVFFGSSAPVSGFPATQQELDMGAYLRKSFATFARDPANGLTNELGWPTYNSQQTSAIALGLNGTQFPEAVIDVTTIDGPCFGILAGGGPNF